MKEKILYAHHVGGRGGTISFPEISGFSEDICNVIYEADESCIGEIESIIRNSAQVLPYCLADERRQVKLNLNYCPFTSSIFDFNRDYGQYFEERRLCYSDYLFDKAHTCERQVSLSCKTIDGLFEAVKIPPVDFISIDTQGAELLILKGAATMIARKSVAVYCEVNFADLYHDAPLFGDIDSFMRKNGFILAGLWPWPSFGYMRIPRNVRGPGVPLQGEALYLLKPENVKNEDPRERQARLEKLAFCSLAFGFTDIAYRSLQLSEQIDEVISGNRHDFLTLFFHEIQKNPTLPPLWHEIVEGGVKRTEPMPLNIGHKSRHRLHGLIKRLISNPTQFWLDAKIYLLNHKIKILIFFNAHRLGFNKFESLLANYGFTRAAKEVLMRRIR
jgi:FkbM family methyltransferase